MDGLFVEEVAASLVREFLSRKVRGAALRSPGQLLRFGGESGGSPCNFCTFGEGDLPLPAACPGGARSKRPCPGPGELHFPGALSATAHFPPAGQDAAACAGISPAAGAGRRPGSVLPAWFPEHRRQASAQAWRPSSTTTPSQDLHPVKKNCPQKEARGPKKFLTVRPFGPAHQRSVAAALFVS